MGNTPSEGYDELVPTNKKCEKTGKRKNIGKKSAVFLFGASHSMRRISMHAANSTSPTDKEAG